MSKLQEYISQEPPMRRAVVGYAVKDGEILLGERLQSSTNLGVNIVAGIGGKNEIDPKTGEIESDFDALVREVKEEVGLTALSARQMGQVNFYFPHNTKWNQEVIIFIIDEYEGMPTASDEISPNWYPMDEIPWEAMWKDNAIWLPKVLAGEKVKCEFLYNENWEIVEHNFNDDEEISVK